MNIERLKQDLKRHESYRQFPYRDTVGKLTVGYGRNLDDKGISESEADYLLENDTLAAWNEVRTTLPWVVSLDEARQEILTNMAFNMGLGGLLTFAKMLAAARSGDFALAAEEMKESKWAKQVGRRAVELSARMRGEADGKEKKP